MHEIPEDMNLVEEAKAGEQSMIEEAVLHKELEHPVYR